MYGKQFDYIRLPDFIGQNIQLNSTDIKVGQGPQAIRKIFKYQQYDTFEQNQLLALKTNIQLLKYYSADIHTDDVLLRFLYANQFDIDAAFKHFQICYDLLTQPNKLNLSEDVQKLYKKGVLYIEGRTKDFKPTIVINTQLVEDLILFEKAITILCAIVEDYMFFPGKVETLIVIIQTQDQSVYKLQMETIYEIIRNLQLSFPNICEAIYILNPSLSLNLAWGQLEEHISELTRNKIKFLKHNELPLLSEMYQLDQFEMVFGGQKVIQSYWPPDPNDYLRSAPPPPSEHPSVHYSEPPIQFEPEEFHMQQQEQPQFVMASAFQTQSVYQPTPRLPDPPESEKKKKCICVKCSRDLEEVVPKPKDQNTPTKSNQKSQPASSRSIQPPTAPVKKEEPQKKLDDTYVSYQRKYDSYIDESYMRPSDKQEQYGELSFNDKKDKPTFKNPYYQNDQSMTESQQIQPKAQPKINQKVSVEIQANMDDTYIEEKAPSVHSYKSKPKYEEEPVYKPQNGAQQFSKSKQASFNAYEPSVHSQQQLQQQQQQQQQQQYQQQQSAFQPQQSYGQPYQSQNFNQPTPQQFYQPSSQQQIQHQYYPQSQPSYNPYQQSYPMPQQQITQTPVLVQDFENTQYNHPQVINDPRKKYDFSEWDKYNDSQLGIDPLNQPNPYTTNSYKPSEFRPSEFPVIGGDYRPSDYKKPQDYSEYRPGEFRLSDYNSSDIKPGNYNMYDFQNQQNYPMSETQTQKNNQLYPQKPGQQACSIF